MVSCQDHESLFVFCNFISRTRRSKEDENKKKIIKKTKTKKGGISLDLIACNYSHIKKTFSHNWILKMACSYNQIKNRPNINDMYYDRQCFLIDMKIAGNETGSQRRRTLAASKKGENDKKKC